MHIKKLKIITLIAIFIMSLTFIGCQNKDDKLSENLKSAGGTWILYSADDNFKITDEKSDSGIQFTEGNIAKLYDHLNDTSDIVECDFRVKNGVIELIDPLGNVMGNNTKKGDIFASMKVKSINGNTIDVIFNNPISNKSFNAVLRKQAKE